MTFSAIYNEVAAIRFNTGTAEVARVKNWVNAAETAIWNSADWLFRRVPAASLTISAASRTPAMPTDFGKATRLFDDLGAPLRYLDPDRWEETYLGDTSSARPCDYTVINRQVYLGPTPQSAYTFKLAYQRRYAHFNNAAAVTAGVMSVDTDYPLWDAEFHYVLVPAAISIGATLEGDPFASDYATQRDELLAAMESELVLGTNREILQWGSGGCW